MNEIPIWYLVLLDRINALRNCNTKEKIDWNVPDAYGYTSALVTTRTITLEQRHMIDTYIDNAASFARKNVEENWS